MSLRESYSLAKEHPIMFIKLIVGVSVFVSGCLYPVNNDSAAPLSGIEINKPIVVTSTTTIINNNYDLWEIDKKKDLGYVYEEECPSSGSCDIDEDIWINHYPSLNEYVNIYFRVEDRSWAIRVAFCESSADPKDQFSEAVNDESGAVGWFQHLPKWWDERSVKAGFEGFEMNHPEANVGVASWLYYKYGGSSHWNSSKSCWQV